MAKAKYITPSLVAFCAQAESAVQPLTVCRVTHPDAIDGDAFEGTYAGYPLVNGKTAEALLSDGSTYPAPAAPSAPAAVIAPVDPTIPAGGAA